jgi:hypothetical protein
MVKYFLSFLLLCSFYSKVSAQQNFFIYLESETKEPFYVLIDGKTNYSSSLNGFITIPQMKNGDYDAEVGFVKNKYPEHHFIISIKGMDVGYIIRKAKENTFSLLNLQTFTVVAPAAVVSTATTKLQQAPSEQNLNTNNTTLANKLKQKPNCTIATEADYNLLKKQMQAAKTELEMIADAEPTFGEKCFSTEQIKKLSTLVTTDKNKLSFFLSAKDCIYDGNNYASLQGQLSDPAIIKQFKNAL